MHLALVWFQKHTQFPGPGRTEKNVVGVRVMPVFAVKSGAFFAVTVGVLGLMGGLLQINPIWNFGPVQAVPGLGGVAARLLHDVDRGPGSDLCPPWEFYRSGTTPSRRRSGSPVIMGLIFVLLVVYPFLEKRFTGDNAHHNLLQRPRDVPGAHLDRRHGDRVLHGADAVAA